MTEESVEAGTNEEVVEKMAGTIFPYDAQTDHWDVDFNDTNKSYEGSALPLWLLAGWAAFVLWAVVYLVVGLPSVLN